MRSLTPVRRVWGLLLVSVVLLAGCKVDARVDVTLRADGSGTVTARVTLDADAVRRLTTAPIAQAVPLADMRAAGWKVSGWTKSSGGSESITVSHGFVGQTDLARRLADLVGTTGVLHDPAITRTRVGSSARRTRSRCRWTCVTSRRVFDPTPMLRRRCRRPAST